MEKTIVAETNKIKGSSSRKEAVTFSYILIHILLIFLASFYILPLILPFLFAFKTNLEFAAGPWNWPKALYFDNFQIAWDAVHLGEGMRNTLVVCAGAIIFTVPFAAMAGYIFSRFRTWVTDIFFYILMGGFFIPVQLVLIPLVKINHNLGLDHTLIGVFLAMSAFGIPFWSMIYRSFFNGIPKDMMEAAKIDGAGNWMTFFYIMFPLARAATGLAMLLTFFGAWNDFLLSLILINKQELFTLQLRVSTFTTNMGGNFFPQLSAGLLLAVAPTVILYALLHKQIIEGATLGGALKG